MIDSWIVIVIIIGCMILFIKEWFSVEVVALMALIMLVLTNILTPGEAFSGFGDPALITIGAVFVLSAGLVQTGVTDYIGQKIEFLAKGRYILLLLLLTSIVIVLSGFMNNVAATAVFLPMVIGMSRKSKIHRGKLLIPLAYASMLGGTCTVIGTSTNMVMSSYLQRNGLPGIDLFEFTPVGVIIAISGILYLVLYGHKLLPQRGELDIEENYHLREYLTELIILDESPLIGKSIQNSQLAEKLDLTIIGINRGKKRIFAPNPQEILQSGDLLLVKGKINNILKIKDTFGIELKPDMKLAVKGLEDENVQLAEVVITPQSDLIGKTLKGVQFRQRYELVVLAIYREGHPLRQKISRIRLELGDVLLVQGEREHIQALRLTPDFLFIDQTTVSRFKKQKAGLAILIFLSMITLGGLNIIPIVIATVIGAILMVLTRCIDLSDAYQSINWPTILLIAGMTSLGIAMEKTGLAKIFASGLIDSIGIFGPYALLTGFFILTVLLTQPMSNAAAALLLAPIVYTTAVNLELNPRTFIMTISLAASCSFITPLEPACALVYGPGKYRFVDFTKCGTPLTLICALIILIFVPIFWPFHP